MARVQKKNRMADKIFLRAGASLDSAAHQP
jgi:hypothetical protein